MSKVDIPTLDKYGRLIGEAVRGGDTEAKKIFDWYNRGYETNDLCAIALSEMMARDWIEKHLQKNSENL